MTVQHIILQKFTNFHAIRSWSFQNICNEIGLPHFFVPPCMCRSLRDTQTSTVSRTLEPCQCHSVSRQNVCCRDTVRCTAKHTLYRRTRGTTPMQPSAIPQSLPPLHCPRVPQSKLRTLQTEHTVQRSHVLLSITLYQGRTTSLRPRAENSRPTGHRAESKSGALGRRHGAPSPPAARGLRERCTLPQQGPWQSPGHKCILVYF